MDEAQQLTAEMLEELRLLTNLETPTHKLLQIVLSGQTELEGTSRPPVASPVEAAYYFAVQNSATLLILRPRNTSPGEFISRVVNATISSIQNHSN